MDVSLEEWAKIFPYMASPTLTKVFEDILENKMEGYLSRVEQSVRFCPVVVLPEALELVEGLRELHPIWAQVFTSQLDAANAELRHLLLGPPPRVTHIRQGRIEARGLRSEQTVALGRKSLRLKDLRNRRSKRNTLISHDVRGLARQMLNVRARGGRNEGRESPEGWKRVQSTDGENDYDSLRGGNR